MARENSKMQAAKNAQKDEFYTLYSDIQKEINCYVEYNPDTFRDKTILLPCDDPEWSNFTKFFAQNFTKLGLKKLISTSYSADKKYEKYGEKFHQVTMFEYMSPNYNEKISKSRGKIFTLERDENGDQRTDINDLQWDYLEGDGDFRSEEVTKLRDECDIICTNPPFSLWRQFFSWITEAKKKFLIIGNINSITYQEVFPHIKNNDVWLGHGMGRWISGFIVPDNYELYGSEARIEGDKRIVSTNNCLWLTNLDHGKRHIFVDRMTMADNIKFSKHKKIREEGYPKFDNFDAIDVPYSDAIPSDYDGIMAVPISFLDKYNPSEYEIVGEANHGSDNEYDLFKPIINGEVKFKRLLIKRKKK